MSITKSRYHLFYAIVTKNWYYRIKKKKYHFVRQFVSFILKVITSF